MEAAERQTELMFRQANQEITALSNKNQQLMMENESEKKKMYEAGEQLSQKNRQFTKLQVT